MIIAVDNNVLVQLVTYKVVSQKLIDYLAANNATLLLPLPVLSEFLAYDFNARRSQLLASPHSKIEKGIFDEKAAYICGDLAHRLDKADKTVFSGKKQKVKVDLQIVAIALAKGATQILSEDADIAKIVSRLQLKISILSASSIRTGLPLFDYAFEQPEEHNKLN